MVDYEKNQPASLELWKPGTIFSVFKEVFRSSKIGMLHLLPPARCDREAYSQLIYGSCLSLFKESFSKIKPDKMDEGPAEEMERITEKRIDHYNDTGFAIFCLLALFETNPMPREFGIDNPLELLPIGLKASDDPLASNRRSFSKNIRIDRQNFSLMLRLKELALARKSDGERLFFERQRLHLQDIASSARQNGSENDSKIFNHGRYGMSTDIMEALERLIPSLELCEYTGPVGAEAFAGHEEYPHDISINRLQKNHEEQMMMLENQFYKIEPSSAESAEIASLLQKYKASVSAIRIPQRKFSGIKRLQRNLRPLFSQTETMLFDKSTINEIGGTFHSGHGANDTEMEEDYSEEELCDFDETQYESESVEHSKALSNYKVALDRRINAKLQKALRASIVTLLARKELLFPISDIANGITKSELDADEVSSIGHGGISIATRHVKAPPIVLRARFADQRTTTRKPTKQTLTNDFLTAKQTTADSSDEDSIDSEITLSSFSDSDGVEGDEISVATSAFGKKALKDLLQNVADEDIDLGSEKGKRRNKKPKPGRKTLKKRKNKTVDDSPDAEMEKNDEAMSTATSTFGKRALDDLLKRAVRTEIDTIQKDMGRARNKKQPSNQKRRKSKTGRNSVTKDSPFESRRGNEIDDELASTSAFGKNALDNLLQSTDSQVALPEGGGDEEISVATSAFGKRALDDLLKKANHQTKKLVPKTRKEQKRGKVSKYCPQSTRKGSEGEEASIATSAFGERALDDLLKRASSHANKLEKAAKINKQKITGVATKQARSTSMGSEEEVSVATSAYGKRALDDLLERAHRENVTNERKRLKRNAKHEKVFTEKGKMTSKLKRTVRNTTGEETLRHILDNVGEKDVNTGGKIGLNGTNASLNPQNDDGEISVATSAFGKKALDDLLHSVDEE